MGTDCSITYAQAAGSTYTAYQGEWHHITSHHITSYHITSHHTSIQHVHEHVRHINRLIDASLWLLMCMFDICGAALYLTVGLVLLLVTTVQNIRLFRARGATRRDYATSVRTLDARRDINTLQRSVKHVLVRTCGLTFRLVSPLPFLCL